MTAGGGALLHQLIGHCWSSEELILTINTGEHCYAVYVT